MKDYIDILLWELGGRENRYLSGACYRRQARLCKAERALRESLTKEQLKLYFAYEEAHNQMSAACEMDLARQAFLLAKEIFR